MPQVALTNACRRIAIVARGGQDRTPRPSVTTSSATTMSGRKKIARLPRLDVNKGGESEVSTYLCVITA